MIYGFLSTVSDRRPQSGRQKIPAMNTRKDDALSRRGDMADNSEIERLRTRCNGFAEKFLRDLEKHPHFPEVVEELLRIEGKITRIDIEQVFFRVTVANRDNK